LDKFQKTILIYPHIAFLSQELHNIGIIEKFGNYLLKQHPMTCG